MAADRHLLSCQLKINGLDEFKPYREHLLALRDKYRAMNDTMNDETVLRRNQGRIMQLNDILEELEQAPALAQKIGGA